MDKSTLLDVANETVRKYGGPDPDFAAKMSRRLRRRFSVEMQPEEISRLAGHFREVYTYGAALLRDYVEPRPGEYAVRKDIDLEGLLDALAKKFPGDDPEVLSKIIDWVIYYEYLR